MNERRATGEVGGRGALIEHLKRGGDVALAQRIDHILSAFGGLVGTRRLRRCGEQHDNAHQYGERPTTSEG